jgi:peptidyl-prolyl cis-trans isomerase C
MVAALLLIGGCGKRATAPTVTATLDDAIAARVGGHVIDVETVERIAAAQHLSPRNALDLAVEDALLAEHAKGTAPPYAPTTHLERLAFARALMEQIVAEARAQGPATKEELQQVIDGWWWELDRPELFRVTHAVVLPGKDATPERQERARALAEKVHAAVLGAKANEFSKRVEAVDAGDLKVKVESLSPVASDGRAVDLKYPPKRGGTTSRYNAAFAVAATSLREIGEISPVVQTPFGYHVMMLIERVPAQRAPQSELDREVFDQRANKIQSDLLGALRGSSNVAVLDQASALTGLIRVAQ